MADWKTYAKAARNTARRQAPEARDAARRAGDRASGYVRAAGRAVDEGWREDGRPGGSSRSAEEPRSAGSSRSTDSSGTDDGSRQRGAAPRRVTTESLSRDAAAYYTVASRRVQRANIIPRLLRALRDALLIGVSLLAIWAVLAAAGLPIPFSTVLLVVGVIVAASFGAGVYAQWKRSQEAFEAAPDPRER